MATVEAPIHTPIRLHEGPFVNEPLVDFTKDEMPARCAPPSKRCVASWAGNTTHYWRPAGQDQRQNQVHQSAKPSQVVGLHQKAGKEHVEPAVQAALKAFASWSQTSFEDGPSLLFT